MHPAYMWLAAQGARERFLHLTATTTASSETVTIARLTSTSDFTVLWGDGTSSTYAAGTDHAPSHVYATAGSYQVRVTRPDDLTQVWIRNAKLSGFNTADLRGADVSNFYCNNLGTAAASTIDTADMVNWTGMNWYCYSLPSGSSITIDTADMVNWTGMSWGCYSLPSGSDITIDTADMTGWTGAYWRCYGLPTDASITVSADPFAGFRSCTTLSFRAGLSTTDVDKCLWGLYQAAITPRTGTAGTIDLGGSGDEANDPPSGTDQAATSCPVTASTPGREIRHELLNDGCGEGFGKWATVTVN
jgi:hypothetical protein